MTTEQAQQRIAAQMPMEEKSRLAHEVIDCSGSIEATEEQIAETLKRLLQSPASNKNA
jgi:dephospho-CoA kinase